MSHLVDVERPGLMPIQNAPRVFDRVASSQQAIAFGLKAFQSRQQLRQIVDAHGTSGHADGALQPPDRYLVGGGGGLATAALAFLDALTALSRESTSALTRGSCKT